MSAPPSLPYLKQELARWVEQGLLSVEQQEKILALYPAASPPGEGRRVAAWLPVILIGMAVVLIGVGLILFYAANWRKMAPALKLAQILGLLVLVNGGSFVLLFGRRPLPIAGRGLLVLGMLGFGAAIGLVAQTYHISAHPSHAVLLWLLGVIAISAVMQERIGYYLATLLALTWQGWELAVYDNFNPWFPLLVLLLGWLFYRVADPVGLLLAGLLLLLWGYLADGWLLARGRPEEGILPLLFLQIPLGVCLIAYQRSSKPPLLELAAAVGAAIGWVLIFSPLIGLSWPIRPASTSLVFLTGGLRPLLVQHLAFTILGGLLLRRLIRERAAGVSFLAALLLFGAAALVLPLGHSTPLLIYTHLGLVGFLLGILFDAHRLAQGRAAQRTIALVLTVATLLIKSAGFLIMGGLTARFYIAYLLGALVLALLIFLIGRALPVLLAGRAGAAPYPGRLLDGICTLVVFGLLYAASFQVAPQSSIFSAAGVVLIMLGLFVVLCLVLYIFLWRRSADRLPLAISALLFGATLLMLLLSGPRMPWQLYALVFNLLLLVLQGLLLLHATRVNSIVLANLVIFAFALQIITRYFDIFWDLLSGSLLFIVTGLLVFVGGFVLELNRRRLVQRMREGPA